MTNKLISSITIQWGLSTFPEVTTVPSWCRSRKSALLATTMSLLYSRLFTRCINSQPYSWFSTNPSTSPSCTLFKKNLSKLGTIVERKIFASWESPGIWAETKMIFSKVKSRLSYRTSNSSTWSSWQLKSVLRAKLIIVPRNSNYSWSTKGSKISTKKMGIYTCTRCS